VLLVKFTLFIRERRRLKRHLHLQLCISLLVITQNSRERISVWLQCHVLSFALVVFTDSTDHVTRCNISDVTHRFMPLSSARCSASQRVYQALLRSTAIDSASPHWGFINSLLRIRSNNFETDSILYHTGELGRIGTIRKALPTSPVNNRKSCRVAISTRNPVIMRA
jgi:hypothetical protein